MEMWDQGSPGVGSSCRRPTGGWLRWAQVEQAAINSFTSLFIEDHQECLLGMSDTQLIPG